MVELDLVDSCREISALFRVNQLAKGSYMYKDSRALVPLNCKCTGQ